MCLNYYVHLAYCMKHMEFAPMNRGSFHNNMHHNQTVKKSLLLSLILNAPDTFAANTICVVPL